MELLSNLFKIFSTIFPFADFTYILQQEEYSSKRLIKWLPRFYFRRNIQVREHLKYTQHAKAIFLTSLALWLSSLLVMIILFPNTVIRLGALAMWLLTIPLFVLVGNVLTNPYFDWIKTRIRKQAKSSIAKYPDLIVITIAGSYGKTTTKNFIQQLIQYNYRTQMIPGNINTPAGIASWLNRNFTPSTEVLIMEVDAYEIGEIARSCEIAPADIAVLTNIGDQHLERFHDSQDLAIALSEVFTSSKPQAQCICDLETWQKLNFDNSFQKFHEITTSDLSYQGQKVDVPKLSSSNIANLRLALCVAEILDIPAKFVIDTIEQLQLPERRQRETEIYGYSAIDDSYNISFTTAQAGIEAAKTEAKKQNKKLLVITAGIPELAASQHNKNTILGSILGQKADHIIILKSMLAKDVISGITDSNKYSIYPSLKDFLQDLSTFPTKDWFLLVQPELNDLYY